jgi:hypothetical protein
VHKLTQRGRFISTGRETHLRGLLQLLLQRLPNINQLDRKSASFEFRFG